MQITGEGWLQRWDAESGRLLKQIRLSKEELRGASLSSDGKLIAIGGFRVDPATQQMVNWFVFVDGDTGQEKLKWEVPERGDQKIALSPDGSTLAYGSRDLHVVDVKSQTEIFARPIDGGRIGGMTFSPDSKLLAVAQRGGVLLLDRNGKEEPRTIAAAGDPRSRTDLAGAILFIADGSQVAISHSGAVPVTLHDVVSGKQLQTYAVPGIDRWNLHSIALSPDGKTIVAPIGELGIGGGIAFWELESGKLIRRLPDLAGTNAVLAFSPDGQRLAAMSTWDLTLRVWNVATGQLIGADLPGHVKPPGALRFFDQDRKLVSAGDDGTIRIWNLADSRQLQVIRPQLDGWVYDRWIRAMDVSPDETLMASSSFDNIVRIWDLKTGREIYNLPGHGRTGGNRALQFTPDSKQLVSWGDDMRVCVWDVATGKSVSEFHAQPEGIEVPQGAKGMAADPFGGLGLRGGCFAADGSTLNVVLKDIRRFSVATGAELPKIEASGGVFSHIATSPDNQYLLVAGWSRSQALAGAANDEATKTHPIELWSLPENKLLQTCDSPGQGTDQVAFSPDGKLVALTTLDHEPRVELRTVPELKETGKLPLPSRGQAVQFSKSGKLVAASIADGTILVWDLKMIETHAKP